ncbi:MAG: diguanylate cyclase [Myxococcales bacterium]
MRSEHLDSAPPMERVRRLLIVDDLPKRSQDVVDIFSSDDYDVAALLDSDDTLEYVAAQPPDLVLIHSELAGTSGVELCGELRMRDELRLIPIILYSETDNDEDSVVRGLLAGADDYVAVSGRHLELRARVRVQLRNRRDRELLRWAEVQHARLKDAAMCDPLTGLSNRRAGDRAVAKVLAAGGPITCLLIDIDHFKQVNDVFGHAVGDAVLQEVARTLQRRARKDDVVVRYGGEEFLVLIHGIPIQIAPGIAERYRAAVSDIVFAPNLGPRQVTISIGVAVSSGDETGLTREQLFAVADAALYQAKRAGRDRVVLARIADSPLPSNPTGRDPAVPRTEEAT